MNERILGLMEQAKSESRQWLGSKPATTITYDELEKFAELIVRECVAICQDTDGEDNIDAKSGRQDCAVEIREHFGVAE